MLQITIKGTDTIPASDLGYLLVKNPAKGLQTYDQSFGKAHVFWTKVAPDVSSVVLMIDYDSVAAVKDGKYAENTSLSSYINDRPYVSGSHLAVAMIQVLRDAVQGRCKDRPNLVDHAFELTAVVTGVCSERKVEKLFQPLGYEVTVQRQELDSNYPEWGLSRYANVTLKATKPIKELLRHLYILLPVLDGGKHYWVGEDEGEKLIRFGDGWLATHPEKKYIVSRYLKHQNELRNKILDQLKDIVKASEVDEFDAKEEVETPQVEVPDVNVRKRDKVAMEDSSPVLQSASGARDEWVMEAIKSLRSKKIVDIGCGEGRLLKWLSTCFPDRLFGGVDASQVQLHRAKDKLGRVSNVKLFQSALGYTDVRLKEYDTVVLTEVIEHIEPSRLNAVFRILMGITKPKNVLVTTPNVEYNKTFGEDAGLRHPDHRFEWTRKEFQDWANKVATKYGYKVEFSGVGKHHPEYGHLTQACQFIKGDVNE